MPISTNKTSYITVINTSSILSTNYQLYFVDATNGNITITLPTITGDATLIKFTRVDASLSNSVTINANSGNQIDGGPSFDLTQGSFVNLISYQSNWFQTG